jgi:hypothetical protein
VDHLDKDHRVRGRLNDLVGVVVQHVRHHRPAGVAEADDAALAHRARFRIVIAAEAAA